MASSSTSTSVDEHEGYVQNVKEINDTAFSFDLQQNGSGVRFVCFSPEKRKEVDSNLISPVKVKRTRMSSKGKDIVFGASSVMEETKLDFEPISYDDLNVSSLHLVPVGTLLDLDLAIVTKINSKSLDGNKKVDTYVVGDETGSCKLSIWNDCAGDVKIGQAYRMTNIRLQKDIFDSYCLSTPQKGFKTTKIDKTMNPPSFKSAGVLKSKVGEIGFIDSIMRYKLCSNQKCGKKLPTTANKSIMCENCKGFNKLKFCSDGMFVKFVFVEEEGEKTTLTMFQDVISKLVPDARKLTDENLQLRLTELEDMKITLSRNGDTVCDAEILSSA